MTPVYQSKLTKFGPVSKFQGHFYRNSRFIEDLKNVYFKRRSQYEPCESIYRTWISFILVDRLTDVVITNWSQDWEFGDEVGRVVGYLGNRFFLFHLLDSYSSHRGYSCLY